MQIWLYKDGFISVSADEFSRGIRAAEWALHPQFDILTDIKGVWLPFEKYVNGLAIFIWPDVILAPRMTAFLASCLLLVSFYLIVRFLFESFTVTLLATVFAVSQPWYVWLSGTPMLEMYYFAFFFVGLFFLIVWLKEMRKGLWLFAGICFLFASGFHVQSWTWINLVNLLTLPYLCRMVRLKNYLCLAQLVAYYVLSNGFIIIFTLSEFVYTGQVFSFFASHTVYAKWLLGGYTVPVIEKLLVYARLLVDESSGTFWLCLLLALIFLVRAPNYPRLLPLLLMMLTLALNSILNVFSGPPAAALGRYSLFHILLLSPYVAYGIVRLFEWAQDHSQPFIKYPLAVVSIVLFAVSLGWGVARIPQYPKGMPPDAVEIGRSVNMLLAQTPGKYLLELHYWDYLGVQLMAGHYSDYVYDREQDYFNFNTPSLLFENANIIYATLASENVRYVVLEENILKNKAQQLDFLEPQQAAGTWTIYRVVTESAPLPDKYRSRDGDMSRKGNILGAE